jgi:hypothetical protein
MHKKVGFVSALAVIVLAACGATSSSITPSSSGIPSSSSQANVIKAGIGYGLVHLHYVGIVTLTTSNDVITEATIDEYFLPYNWGKVTATDGADDTVTVTTNRGTSVYAEFVKVGDKVFTATVLGTAPAQSIKYSSEGIDDIDAWVATEANAMWYVEQIELGLYGYVDALGVSNDFVGNDNSAKVAMKKSTSGYWTVVGGLGWVGNIEAMVDLLVGSTFDFTSEDFVKNSEGFWANESLVTGATLTDFKDYLAVAARAFANRVIVA